MICVVLKTANHEKSTCDLKHPIFRDVRLRAPPTAVTEQFVCDSSDCVMVSIVLTRHTSVYTF